MRKKTEPLSGDRIDAAVAMAFDLDFDDNIDQCLSHTGVEGQQGQREAAGCRSRQWVVIGSSADDDEAQGWENACTVLRSIIYSPLTVIRVQLGTG